MRESAVAGNSIVPTRSRRALSAIWLYVALIVIYQRTFRQPLLEYQVLQNWTTVFLSVVLQALPFLVLGVVLSALISEAVPAAWLARALPARSRRAVPTAALAGVLLPGCECSSIPVAGRLISRGVQEAAALTFLLAAPAVNPIVLVSTAVAFPGRPEMVGARLVASLATATVVGLIWSRNSGSRRLRVPAPAPASDSGVSAVAATATHDFLQAGGFLVVGAALVASLQTLAPTGFLAALGGSGVVAVMTMGALAFALAVCSEGDAFVAAALTQFSLTSRLAFLVVGPMVDIKLVLLQAGTFGRRFAMRFAPLTFIAALLISGLVGSVLL
jgi:uncharacterized membrane protein YraQ (UPF0718 family)